MLTRIEIDGFKSFEKFALDVQPFSAVVGPNASGKSNLFDALKFLSSLSKHDVRTAMQDLRGEPEELFRQTVEKPYNLMHFAVEVLLDPAGADSFGKTYVIKAQRLRYELSLSLKFDAKGNPRGIFVIHESCTALAKKDDRSKFSRTARISYSGQVNPFIKTLMSPDGEPTAFVIRQDGPTGDAGATKRGRPITLSATEATRTALSTITTAEFPHLFALRELLCSIRFLEINPHAARKANDRFEKKELRSDASNLAAVLANLKEDTGTEDRPDGVVADISADLASLIPSVHSVMVFNDSAVKEYSFGIATTDSLHFSSRVISDGTLRLLALLAVLDDPKRKGILCFEEPENGVHEGRIPSLVELLRGSVSKQDSIGEEALFQILVNTHSPAVMKSLNDDEIVVADAVSEIDPSTSRKVVRTRMRVGVETRLDLGFDPETNLTRSEVERLLRRKSEAA